MTLRDANSSRLNSAGEREGMFIRFLVPCAMLTAAAQAEDCPQWRGPREDRRGLGHFVAALRPMPGRTLASRFRFAQIQNSEGTLIGGMFLAKGRKLR